LRGDVERPLLDQFCELLFLLESVDVVAAFSRGREFLCQATPLVTGTSTVISFEIGNSLLRVLRFAYFLLKFAE
jgi:hypothetical protein